jgi:hypothetical protein
VYKEDNLTQTDWIQAIATCVLVFATAGLAIVAAFQDRVRGWLTQPKLDVNLKLSPPDCHKTSLKSITKEGVVVAEASCYYFRLLVKNTGNQRAELVEVWAAELKKRQADGSFKTVEEFLPMNLVWSHVRRVLDSISPDMQKFCDLGHIIDPAERPKFPMEDNPKLGVASDKAILSLDLEMQPFTMSHLIPPGAYQLTLKVAAANAKPVSKRLEVILTGDWYKDERKMLGEGITIRTL